MASRGPNKYDGFGEDFCFWSEEGFCFQTIYHVMQYFDYYGSLPKDFKLTPVQRKTLQRFMRSRENRLRGSRQRSIFNTSWD
jgi:hypothetical protein